MNSLLKHEAEMKTPIARRLLTLFGASGLISLMLVASPAVAQVNSSDQPLVNDSHFHLTNYIQNGTDVHTFLQIMGSKVGRVALFGIPLQQQWSFRADGERAP